MSMEYNATTSFSHTVPPEGAEDSDVVEPLFEDPMEASAFVFIMLLFFLYNAITGGVVLKAMFGLPQEGRDAPVSMLVLCPHALIGIVMPPITGYAWKGVPGLFLMASPSVILPYILATNVLYEERVQSIRGTSDAVELPSPTLPSSIEDNLLIIKKVLPASEPGDGATPTKIKGKNHKKVEDVSQSYRSTHPKSNIYARSMSTAMGNPESLSVQLCAICLDEYQAGEEIAWSRNEQCHHVFHKSCLLDFLRRGHEECPICRNTYHVMVDVELGGS